MQDAEPIEADLLIEGATLVTMDARRRIITDGALAVSGDRIAAVGRRDELAARVVAGETIDGRRFVMTPGFVNGHIHVTETLIKGFIPEDVGFDEGIWRWSAPLYHLHAPAEQALAAELAAASMMRTGTTCFLEAGTILALDEVVEALDGAGIRGRVGRWAMDRAEDECGQAARTDAAIRSLEAELAAHPGGDGRRIAAWPLLIGHATVTDELWRAAKVLADAHGASISAHMSPVELDPDWHLARFGRRPVEHLADIGVLGPNLCLTHMVHVDAAEAALMAQARAVAIHCPGAAMKCAFGVARHGLFPEMDAGGVRLMLGTDGADHADMMRSMTLVASLFKDARRDRSLFPAARALELATIGGAEAMGMARSIGSLEVGKKADLVLHDADRPEWRPLLNPLAQLVWSADGRGVHSVWIDGLRVVDACRCTTVDEDRLYARAQKAAEALAARSGLPTVCPWPMT